MKRILLFLITILSGSTIANAQWVQLDEPLGANVLDMAMKGDAIYISVANQLYRSTDEGQSWVNISANLPAGVDINSIGATSSALYAGLNDSGQLDKFFVSTDDGASWTTTGGQGALNLAIKWENIGDTAFTTTNFGGVFRTTDNGQTFEGMPGVGIGNTIDVWEDELFYVGTGFVRVSEDRGDSISPNIGSSSLIQWRFGSVRTALRVGNATLAGAQGVFKLDPDSVWQFASEGMPSFLGSPTPIVSKLALIDGSVWAFSNEGIFVSVDTAETWNKLDIELATGFIQRVKVVNNVIHLGTQNGYFVSNGATDTTITFEHRISGLRHATVTGMRSYGDDLFFFGQSLGILKTTDGGETLTQFAPEFEFTTFVDFIQTADGYIASDGIKFYKKIGEGQWSIIEEQILPFRSFGRVGDALLGGSGSQVYKSIDNGLTWEAKSQAFALGALAPTTFTVKDSTILAGFSSLNVFGAIARSTDLGETWTITAGAGANTLTTDIVYIDEVAYAAVGTVFTGGGIAKSTDDGVSWELLSNEISSEVGGAFTIKAVGSTLYTVSFNGIWKSTDGAESWQKLNLEGLPSTYFFTGVPFIFHENELFYAPATSSIYKTNADGDVTSNEELDQIVEFELEQNYPNPFNPSTRINFSIPRSGLVTLTVYNLLGQEVASLVNGTLSAGQHQVTFDASQLSSGVYLYRIQSGTHIQTRKMMLIK